MSGAKFALAAAVAAMLTVWAVWTVVLADDPSAQPSAVVEPVPSVDADPRPPAQDSGSVRDSSVVASDEVSGVPVGYPRSTAGAATAAVNWVASFPTLVRLGPIRLDDTLGQVLSERRVASASEEVLGDYFALIDELGPDFADRVWVESPLQVDVAAADEQTASVAVWAVLVTGDPVAGPVEAVWRTHRIDLVWERDDWRIDDVAIAEGPTPVPNEVGLPSPASDFGVVDEWGPAVFADTSPALSVKRGGR